MQEIFKICYSLYIVSIKFLIFKKGLMMFKKFSIKSFALGICFVLIVCMSVQAAFAKVSQKTLRKYLTEHSLVVVKDNKTTFYEGRGIKPLINYLKENNFENAYVADKRIGKASALLLVYGKARQVYTPVISKPAVKVFEDNNVKYTADEVVENIKNQSGTDLCPMEKKVMNINSPQEAYELFSELFKDK